MKLLHLGDLHFKLKNTLEQNKIINALLESLEGKSIDFIFFSGDLVINGASKQAFEKAHEALFNPLFEKLKLSPKETFLCAGNHDINREVIINSIITNFSSMKVVDRKTIENWSNKLHADRKASLCPSQNFFDYLTKNFIYPETDQVDILFNRHIRNIDGKKIGIITINSSWFCSGEREDKGELLFLPDLLEDAILSIKECDIKILMQHHPLNYFKETLLYDLQDIVHSNFNMLLLGHVHKEFLETQYRSNNGIYCNTTKASLCSDGGEIGFSIINCDVAEPGKMKIERFPYLKTENKFYPVEPVIVQIPLGEEKHKQNEIRKKITGKVSFELQEANKLLLNYDENNENFFLESFTEPIISKKSDEETNISEHITRVPLNDVKESNDNYLLFGKDKCGKTTLLKKLLIDYLQEYTTKARVPLYFDFKHFENTEINLDILKILMNYYQFSRHDAQKVIDEGRLILLIDNLNTTSSLHDKIICFLKEHLNIKFIICSEYLTSRIFGEDLDDLSYTKCFFKNLTRNEIRLYTKKNPSLKENDHEVIIERVTAFCKQLHLPMNFWTVSLIVLIFKKSSSDYSKNLFAVLDGCVDEILQKKKFLFEKTNLKFEQYKSLCSQIAVTLYKEYKDTEYACDYSSLIQMVEDYRKKNRRIITGGKEIVDFLLECGILKHKNTSLYTFRLNGIFEYFLAYYVKENEDFKNEIINYESLYLSFKNELEIYSGFNRSDVSFLRLIYEKTKKAISAFTSSYTGSPDDILLSKIDNAFNFDKSIKKLLVDPLSASERDEAFDSQDNIDIDSDVHLKPIFDTTKLNVEVVEKYISILSRVLKNLDVVTDSNLVYEVFEYLLDSYCKLGFYIIDEFKESAKKENLKIRDGFDISTDSIIGEELLKLLSRIIPVLVEAMMYDGLGSLNFSKIIEDKIEYYLKEESKNQYKLFVLYFLLLDIDLKANKQIVDNIIQKIKLSPLKVSSLFKLKFYLAFKSYDNKILETFIKNKIQELEIRLDNKVDLGDIQKSLSKSSKRNLVKRKGYR